MPNVITIGETMVLVVPPQPGRLRHATQAELRIGGAESNVAIGLARLGEAAGWAGWLGDDELGELVLSRIRAEGVDTSQVRRVNAPTGLYLREQVAQAVRVYYYRRHAAASLMEPGALNTTYFDGARILHLSGITPALSESCKDFVPWAMNEARHRGLQVSFDVNYRSKLWNAANARRTIEELLPLVDLLLVGDEEAEALWGASGSDLLHDLAGRGPREVVLKLGARGATSLVEGQIFSHPGFTVNALDPIGAGDAFAAGYLAALLWDKAPEERLAIANAMGAYSVMSAGDYEGLPSRAELFAFIEGRRDLGR